MNDEIRKLIESSGSKIFTVDFIKVNGEFRSLNAMCGVTKHLKGGSSTTAHKANLMTVFDCQKRAYRSINLDTVIRVKMGGKVYPFREHLDVRNKEKSQ